MAKSEDEAATKAKAEAEAEAKAKAKADEEAAAAAKAKAEAEGGGGGKKRPPYAIAEGKSLVCNRGVLEPGAEITPRDVNDDEKAGRKQLDVLAELGYVVKSG